MKNTKLISALFLLVMIFLITACQSKKTPVENSINTQALTDTVGFKQSQSIKDYIATREKALQDYSKAKPQDNLVGMISFNGWQKLDQVDQLAKRYGVTPVVIEFSFRVNKFSFGEIKLEGRSLTDGFNQAMVERFSSQNKSSGPGHGLGTPEMQQQIRQQMAEQQAREKDAYQKGQPIIYGLLITGRASQFNKLIKDKAVRLVDALPASEEEIQFVPDNIRIKLLPINIDQ